MQRGRVAGPTTKKRGRIARLAVRNTPARQKPQRAVWQTLFEERIQAFTRVRLEVEFGLGHAAKERP